jgi:hypothetical protein
MYFYEKLFYFNINVPVSVGFDLSVLIWLESQTTNLMKKAKTNKQK